MANTTKNNTHKESTMKVKLYMDEILIGWGTLDKVASYKANGWTVVLDI